MLTRITYILKWAGRHSGVFLVIVLCLLPVLLWPGSLWQWNSRVGLYRSSGLITGVWGLSLFSLAMVLSGRFGFMESMFGGLDKLTAIHRALGTLSLGLLIVHPLLLAFSLTAVSSRLAFASLLISDDFAVNLGIVALLMMIIVIATSVLLRMKYESAKRVHDILALPLLLGAWHAFLTGSTLMASNGLRIYLFLLVNAALAVWFFRILLGSMTRRRYDYVVTSVERPGQGVVELKLRPVGSSLRFRAGQFVYIAIPGNKFLRSPHPFSVSSVPQSNELSVAVKQVGDFTSVLQTIGVGTPVVVEGPYGRFSYDWGRRPHQVWIAGGIGITPFLSMVRELVTLYPSGRDCPYMIDLYYTARTTADLIYAEELLALARQCNFVRVYVVASETGNRIDVGMIMKATSNFLKRQILMCGPQAMMAALKQQFRRAGVPAGRIQMESFRLLQ